MKKGIVILIAPILFLMGMGGLHCVRWIFSEQYNSNGISHFLVVTIDENQPKEYIGRLNDYNIYIEKLSVDDTCFRSVGAENVTLKEALENNLVSIDDWRKYARKIQSEGNTDILQFENYEIVIAGDDCIIRPITGLKQGYK